jgi:hypothetical protein
MIFSITFSTGSISFSNRVSGYKDTIILNLHDDNSGNQNFKNLLKR